MASNLGHIMTLANSIIGVGILAMPYCFLKCGILLSVILLLLSNLITRLSCFYLLKSSIKTRRKTFELLASYIFGSSGKLMIELCSIGFLLGSSITYFVVIGDIGPQILSKIFGFNQTDSLRTIVMIIVTLVCIIPLCLLRNIESLSFMCITSIIFYFCLVIKIIFEADHVLLAGQWFEEVYWWRPSGVTQCLPIFSMALACQMQLFEIYESLPTQTIDKMNVVVKFGTGICTGVYIMVGFFGYVAFANHPFSGNILLSLSPSFASDVIKVGFVMSVAVSFPLVIFPCRASLNSLLYHRSHAESAHYIPEHRFKCITISMVLVALIIGILIPSIELVIGLVGSTIGIAICIMFPASCFVKTNKKNSTERLLAQFLLVLGVVLMVLGTVANLDAIDNQPNVVIEAQQKPIDTVGIAPEQSITGKKAAPGTEQEVVDKPDDNPFPKPNDPPYPSDKREGRRKVPPKPLNIKAAVPEEKVDDNKEDSIKPPLPQPQSDTLNAKQSNQLDASIVKSANLENVEQSKKEEIEIERVAPNAKSVDLVDKDAIRKEEEIVKEEADANVKQPNNAEENAVPDLKEMVNNVAKEIEETQHKVNIQMAEIKEQMKKLQSQQRLNEPPNAQNANAQNDNAEQSNRQSQQMEQSNAELSNAQKSPVVGSNVRINEQQSNADSIVQNVNLTDVVKQKVVENSEKVNKIGAFDMPIPELLASNSEKKLKSNVDTVQTANDDASKVKHSKNKAPSPKDNYNIGGNNDNNIAGRDLLSEKANESEKIEESAKTL